MSKARKTSYIRDVDDDSDDLNEASTLLDGPNGGYASKQPVAATTEQYSWLDVENPNGWLRVFVVGLCFLNSSYDSFAMNLVLIILAHLHQSLSPIWIGAIATSAQVGKMVGQVLFGALANSHAIPRTRAFVITQIIVMGGALASALAIESSSFLFISWLLISRFVMGVGIGGEYPLSAVIASDTAARRPGPGRGRSMSALFITQAMGCAGAPIVVLLLVVFAPPGSAGLSIVWRLALLITAAPGAALLYYRIVLRDPTDADAFTSPPPTPVATSNAVDTADAASAASTADPDEEYYATMPFSTRVAELRAHFATLFGTMMSWFLFDVIFYANAMFSATLLSRTTPLAPDAPADDVHRHIVHLARVALVIASMAVPGYAAGAMLIDRVGRRTLQLSGFVLMTICYGAMLCLYTRYSSVLEAATWIQEGAVPIDPAALAAAGDAGASVTSGFGASPQLIHALFTLMYGFTFFFGNAGPNQTTYIIPTECFPRHIAAAAHGLSAAAGKAGAVVGALAIPILLSHYGVSTALGLCIVTSAAGVLVTLRYTPETFNSTGGMGALPSAGAKKGSDGATDFDDV